VAQRRVRQQKLIDVRGSRASATLGEAEAQRLAGHHSQRLVMQKWLKRRVSQQSLSVGQ
jgi:hypothetical protein